MKDWNLLFYLVWCIFFLFFFLSFFFFKLELLFYLSFALWRCFFPLKGPSYLICRYSDLLALAEDIEDVKTIRVLRGRKMANASPKSQKNRRTVTEDSESNSDSSEVRHRRRVMTETEYSQCHLVKKEKVNEGVHFHGNGLEWVVLAFVLNKHVKWTWKTIFWTTKLNNWLKAGISDKVGDCRHVMWLRLWTEA